MKNTIFNYDNRRADRFTVLVALEKIGKLYYIKAGNHYADIIGNKQDAINKAIEIAKKYGFAITFDSDLYEKLRNQDNGTIKCKRINYWGM